MFEDALVITGIDAFSKITYEHFYPVVLCLPRTDDNTPVFC